MLMIHSTNSMVPLISTSFSPSHTNASVASTSNLDILKLLLLLEEHSEGDDGAVDEEATDDGHYHGWNGDYCGVCKDCG